MAKITFKHRESVKAKAAKVKARGFKKLETASTLAAKASLPANPKKMDKAKKLAAIEKFGGQMSRSDSALLDGVRLLLESNRSERSAGLATWAVELSDEDFPVAVGELDALQKERDAKLLGQIEKALATGRSKTMALAKKHKNKH
ncbi:MAG: hypothetical protein AB1Z98_31195 [Nannocystaceae bacterium]